ncbi:hypothetical protein GWK47_003676 [Chionoecetes opilio]|uniref:Uncharacterized protein n=1 Tax=Chionoecetes opilio TaxID=41210 RepID=A0A8J5CQA7_CHIOP|nr:hypothetical protein GWK47_003676 [Chionoecetes opilio]
MAAKECIGERTRSRRGFVSTETLEKIEESHAARLAGNQDQHRALSRRTRPLLGRDNERYVRSLAEAVEGHLNANDLRPAYRALKKLRSKSLSRASAIRAADERLVSDMDGQMARWAEYFGQLFTVDPPIEQLHTTGLQAVDADPPIDETAPTPLDESSAEASETSAVWVQSESIADRILALRDLVERRREFRQGMLAAYVGLKKVFDSVHLKVVGYAWWSWDGKMASGKPAGFSEEDGARMPSGEKDSVEKDGDSGDEQKPDVMTLLTAMMGKMNAQAVQAREAEERAEVRTRELRVAMHEGWQAVQRESQQYTDEKLDIVKEELLGEVELVRRQAEEAATVALRGVTECRGELATLHQAIREEELPLSLGDAPANLMQGHGRSGGGRGSSLSDGKAAWRACRARLAALASSVRVRKGLAVGLPPRRMWKGKRPAYFTSAWGHPKKGRRRGERWKPRDQKWRPPRARMKEASPYLPLLLYQEDGERNGWPPPKLWQVDDGGGRLRRAFCHTGGPARSC